MGGSNSILSYTKPRINKVVPTGPKKCDYDNELEKSIYQKRSPKKGKTYDIVEPFSPPNGRSKTYTSDLLMTDCEHSCAHTSSLMTPATSIPNIIIHDHNLSASSYDRTVHTYQSKNSNKSIHSLDEMSHAASPHHYQPTMDPTTENSGGLLPEEYEELLQFNPISAKTRETANFIQMNENARRLFIRFVKENQLKWLELLAIQTLSKQGQNPKLSSLQSASKSPSALSQLLHSSTITFHSYTVTKPVLYAQSSHYTDRLSFKNIAASFSGMHNTKSRSCDSNPEEQEPQIIFFDERKTLDILQLTKQLKIKESANLAPASSRSYDEYDNTIGAGICMNNGSTSSKEKSNLEKVLQKEQVMDFMILILLNLFPYSQQYQFMETREWNFNIDEIVFQPGNVSSQFPRSPTNIGKNNNTNYIQEYRIQQFIQQSKNIHKNDSLSNIQTLFYFLSKEIDEEHLYTKLASPAMNWLNEILPTVNSLPFGVTYCKNLSNALTHFPNGFLMESLPIVYVNEAGKDMIGYANNNPNFMVADTSGNKIIGKNFTNTLLPQKDIKSLQFPKNTTTSPKNGQPNYYNDKKLLSRMMEANAKGEKSKMGIIQENKFTSLKFYNLLNSVPIHIGNKYSYLLSLHYNLNSDDAKISDFKVMDDVACLLLMLPY
jgi:hypothetical protein